MANRKLKINKQYGRTAGYASPGEVRNVYNNLLVTQRDVEKWIAKQFEGIDLNDKSKENLARIAQRKKIVKDLWNEWDGKKFVNRPKSMQHLGKTVRGKHTFGTRFNQLLIGAMTLGTGRIDTSEKKLGGIGDPYEIIERLNSMQVKIEGVSRIRDGKDVHPKALTDLGMTLYQPFNKESNVYFNPDLDRTNTTRDLAASRKARLTYKNKFPSQYAANPGGYLSTLQPTNQFFNSPTGEAKSPLSIDKSNEYFTPSSTLKGGGGFVGRGTDVLTSEGGSTALSIARRDWGRYKKGDMLGVMTRSDRRAYNREVLGINT